MNDTLKLVPPNVVQLSNRTVAEAEIVAALEAAEGSIADAAASLGVKRHVLASAISRSEYLRAVHMDFLEAGIDAAQRVVFTAVKQGRLEAATFVLSTVGKERGFSTKQELKLSKAEPRFKDMSEAELTEFIQSNKDTLAELLGGPQGATALLPTPDIGGASGAPSSAGAPSSE